MERDETGLIAGSRALQAALATKDEAASRVLMRLAARYFAKASATVRAGGGTDGRRFTTQTDGLVLGGERL